MDNNQDNTNQPLQPGQAIQPEDSPVAAGGSTLQQPTAPAPLPEQPKKSKKLPFIVAAIILLLSIGVASYLLVFNKEDNQELTNNSKTDDTAIQSDLEQKSASQILDEIRSDLLAYNPNHTEPSIDSYVDSYHYEEEDLTLDIYSDVYLNYSQVGMDIIDQINSSIMAHGLTGEVRTSGTSTPDKSAVLTGAGVSCRTYANPNYARVNCIESAKIDRFKIQLSNVLGAYESSSSSKADKDVDVSFYTNSNNQSYAFLSAKDVSDNSIYAFLTKESDEGDWVKVTDVEVDNGYIFDCDLLTQEQAEAVAYLNLTPMCIE